MQIFVPKESNPEETRIPIIPASVAKLTKAGAEVTVEAGLGTALGHTDELFTEAGAKISNDREGLFASADVVLRLAVPPAEDVKKLKAGATHVSYMDPFREKELVKTFAEAKVSGISMEMIPRTTIAQKMDALSSQANLGGYIAVIIATEYLDKILPLMTTPAGTLSPARVFIIGVGVAGLQAIATAKRLGARVEAFDTRPEVEEQVQSLGAKFVKIDLGVTESTKDGYAKALTPEQIKMQQAGMAKVCGHSDIVITTAQLFGRPAPKIVTAEMVAAMQYGSVIVDMAVETGGNVIGSKLGEIADVNGVSIIGYGNLPGRVPVHASQMYSANMANLIAHFWDAEAKTFTLNREDEIMKSCLITHAGEVVNERIKGVM